VQLLRRARAPEYRARDRAHRNEYFAFGRSALIASVAVCGCSAEHERPTIATALADKQSAVHALCKRVASCFPEYNDPPLVTECALPLAGDPSQAAPGAVNVRFIGWYTNDQLNACYEKLYEERGAAVMDPSTASSESQTMCEAALRNVHAMRMPALQRLLKATELA
jgi:hypothetical protein